MSKWILAATGFLCSTQFLLAQQYKVEEVKVLSTSSESTAMQWLMLAVFVVAALVVAFKPAKRSNLQ